MQYTKKLGPGLGVGFKTSPHGRSGGDGTGFLHSTHDHTKVSAFHHDGHTQGGNRFHNGIANLTRQTFLDLQTAGVEFRNAGQFAETELELDVCVCVWTV